MTSMSDDLPVAVIGAGPVGLAAAAHLLDRGLPFVVLEANGGAASTFSSVAHVRLFSPWRFNVDAIASRILVASGWRTPDPEGLPLARELVHAYLEPLASLVRPVWYRTRVEAISRLGHDKVRTEGRESAPFVLSLRREHGHDHLLARAVIDASGTWANPNPMGADGLPAKNEHFFADRIAYGMPDVLTAARRRYARKNVLVAGSGHSAIGVLIALSELATAEIDTKVLWAVRSLQLERTLGGGDRDGLPARGKLGQHVLGLLRIRKIELYQGFRIRALSGKSGRIEVLGDDGSGRQTAISDIDEIVVATGSRPNLSMTRELRLAHDPLLESSAALAPLIDPNVHSCGSVPPHGHRELAHPELAYYSVGAKSYGRAPNFLMATGYEQVRSVVAALAGDLEAADRVQLVLPKTGVCSADPGSRPEGAALPCCVMTARPRPSGARCCA